jgi:hypothetical protein
MAGDRDEIPRERAPLLLVFSDLSERISALVRARPILIARLIVAPREAIHAIGAFLHLAPEADGPDAEVATIINDTDPRELLRRALPGCPARLYRALDRAGDKVHERNFYERLGAVARGPFGEALLDGVIDEARISYFEALSGMDPAIVALRRALPEATYWVEAVDCLVALLRAHDVLRDDDLRLPPRSGLPAVVRRLRAALSRIEAPEPGFEPPPPFRLIRTTHELQCIGKVYGNCVALPRWSAAEHHIRLLTGTGAYLVADAPPLLAALRRVANGVWYLQQIAGPRNKTAPADVKAALLRDLTATGLRIVAADPQSSLARLEQEARRRRRDAGDDDPEGEEGDFDDAVEDAA